MTGTNDIRFRVESGNCQNSGQSPRPINTSSIKKTTKVTTGIIDVHWYPNEHKMVFDRADGNNEVVDLKKLAPTYNTIGRSIMAHDQQRGIQTIVDSEGNEIIQINPEARRVIIQPGTTIDEAIQILAHEFEHNFVWSVWRD